MLLLVSVIGEFVDGRNYAENGNTERFRERFVIAEPFVGIIRDHRDYAGDDQRAESEKRGEKNRFLFA